MKTSLSKYTGNCLAWLASRKKQLLRLLILLLLLPLLGAALDPHGCRILEGVRVGGLDTGGMTLFQAQKALQEASAALLESQDLPVQLPEETILLSPEDTRARLRSGRAAFAAYLSGRLGNPREDVPLLPYLQLDRAFLETLLSDYAARHDTCYTPASYRLIGKMPELEIEAQAPGRYTQTLELTMGLPTAVLDRADALSRILEVYDEAFAAADRDAYRVAGDFQVDVSELPREPDLRQIYEDLHIPGVDDALDLQSGSMIRGAYGYGFSIRQARAMVDRAQWGDVLRIPMQLQEPEIFADEVYFRDVLGHCETKHTDDANRNHNLTLACASMNGVILQPGETFSYNDTLGQRTKANGYRRAGAYSGWELVSAYGGGICQGSSTLYCAALYADLEIVHRKNHGYKVGYLDAGLDATVNWGGPDFQFRNNTRFPVKIAAEVSDGFVKVTLLGTEVRDYYVEMETEVRWGSSTIYAESYKCRYDRETGELLSRELEAKSNYMR